MQALNVIFDLIATLAQQPRMLLLIALLVTAAVIDWRTYRIPNWLTFGGMAAGLMLSLLGSSAPLSGLLWAFAGLCVGLLVLLPLYMFRVMGAGDVKLMAMVGAFLGMPDIFSALVFTLVTGGIAALVFALHHRAMRRMAGNVADVVQSLAFAAIAGIRPSPDLGQRGSIGRLPYGVSIAIGTTAWLAARQLGYA